MKLSLCITTFNEEQSIEKLLQSVNSQTTSPDEIIIVDGGSTDKTIELIRKNKKVKLIVSRGASIAKGRNLAVKKAKYPVIVMTDAGCICDKNWLRRIIEPFKKKDVSVVAGFYKMTGRNDFQKALMPFLGVMPENFNKNTFLPSTRSIVFRKSLWKTIGGFNEKLDRAGEDTEFNLKIQKHPNIKMKRVKNARVMWEVPDDLASSVKKFFYYARGDVQIGGLTKHNMKVLTIFLRYIIFLYFWELFFVYLVWAFYKHQKYTNNWRQRVYTVIIQVVSDFSVMAGFVWGILNK